MNKSFFMEKERNYDNDGLDPSEEYFRKKKNGTVINTLNFIYEKEE